MIAHPDHSVNATLLLASASPRRRELINLLGLPVQTTSADIDEVSLPGERADEMAARLSHAKARAASISIRQPASCILLASDTVSLRATLDRESVPRNTWNADELVKSLAEVRRIEAQGAVVICGHDAAQWAYLRKGADAYD